MPPSLTPRQELTQRWLRKAASDLESARWLMQRQPPPLDTTCFHCQQAAEKALKAVLVAHSVVPPHTHSLKQLFKLCEPFAAEFASLATSSTWIEIYGVETRYPDSPAEPAQDDAERALIASDEICAFVLKHLPTEVHP